MKSQKISIFKNSFRTNSIFKEAFKINDLGANAISNLTQTHLNTRMSDPEAHSDIQVIEADYNESGKTFTIFFEVDPTFDGKTVLTPSGRSYQGSFYNVVFQFIDVAMEDFHNQDTATQTKMLGDVFFKNDCKIHSNDPSFFYQGAWEDMADKDASVFPFPGPKGDGVWRQKHMASGGLQQSKVRITKHMAQVISSFEELIPAIQAKLKPGTAATPVAVTTPTEKATTTATSSPDIKKGATKTATPEPELGSSVTEAPVEPEVEEPEIEEPVSDDTDNLLTTENEDQLSEDESEDSESPDLLDT